MARGVDGFNLARELTKESAEEIFQAVADTIRNRSGAVPETSPGQAVWNFALKTALIRPPLGQPRANLFARLDRPMQLHQVSITTTGPSRKAGVARQLDPTGRHKASEFTDRALVDFIWAPNLWHALPMVPRDGRMLHSYNALSRGLVWGRDGEENSKQGQPKYTLGVYKLASDVIYLSMVQPKAQHVYGIRHHGGKLEYFDDKQEYMAARQALQSE